MADYQDMTPRDELRRKVRGLRAENKRLRGALAAFVAAHAEAMAHEDGDRLRLLHAQGYTRWEDFEKAAEAAKGEDHG